MDKEGYMQQVSPTNPYHLMHQTYKVLKYDL
jgi:hypothetical protein